MGYWHFGGGGIEWFWSFLKVEWGTFPTVGEGGLHSKIFPPGYALLVGCSRTGITHNVLWWVMGSGIARGDWDLSLYIRKIFSFEKQSNSPHINTPSRICFWLRHCFGAVHILCKYLRGRGFSLLIFPKKGEGGWVMLT